MRILIGILLFMTLIACSNKRADKANVNLADNRKSIAIPDLSVIDSKFPLILSAVNFKDSNNIIHLNDGINSKLEQTKKDYYFKDCSGDSAQTYFSIKDTYINTIRLRDSLQTVFVIIFRHMPDGLINSKILLCNNISKQFNSKTLDFNIHALYDFDSGRLKPTNLKEQFKIIAPEIELMKNKESGMNSFKFTRLYHNGTANAIETTSIKVTENRIDTIDFKRKWLK